MARRRRSAALLTVVGLLVALVLAGGCGDTAAGTIRAVGDPVVDEGGVSPDLRTEGSLPELTEADDPAVGMLLPTLEGPALTGGSVQVSPDDGPQFVVFVAHWCPHCQREVPFIVQLQQDGVIPPSVRVTAVSTAVDERRGNFPPVSWLAEEAWPTPVLADDELFTAAGAFGVSGFPFLVAADATGRVVARTSGELAEEDYERLVELVTAV